MPRLVIVEPAYASTVGHHGEVNRPLLAALTEGCWQAELWTDLALEPQLAPREAWRGRSTARRRPSTAKAYA